MRQPSSSFGATGMLSGLSDHGSASHGFFAPLSMAHARVDSMRRMVGGYWQLLKGRDRGTVAITFLLSLPILMTVIGVLVQYTLLANAKLTVDRAVQAAARSAMTALPTDPVIDTRGGPALVQRAALMTLEALSPVSPEVSADGMTVADALAQVGANPPASYAARYSYAQQATQLAILPIDGTGMNYAASAAPRVRITVQYDFQLTVPLLKDVIGRTATVAGITGRFLTLTSSLDVQLSHGREAPTDGVGDP